MLQAVTSTLLLYAANSCILHEHKDIMQIEKQLNEYLNEEQRISVN